MKNARPFDRSLRTGLEIALVGMIGSFGLVQQTSAQITDPTTDQNAEPLSSGVVPISLVATNVEPSVYSIRSVPGYSPRFSDAVGSGALLVNVNREVTGYYFTISDLNMRSSYTYHLHAATHSGTPTSCEGDKALFKGEVAGAVMMGLDSIAPIRPSRLGVAFVGSLTQPVLLPQPIPLADIGYLNIHPVQNGTVEPGVICANIRLNSGGFVRE